MMKTRAAAATTAWRNRIVGEGEVDPATLLAHPANWRLHPKQQQAALAGALDTVGWVQRCIVNRRTGFVVDGHARVALAIGRNEPTVPVLYVDLSPEEEALVLATLDPIGAMAATDDAKLAALLEGVVVDDAGLLRLLGELGYGRTLHQSDPDAIPEVSEVHVQPGELWALGRHRLLIGDATDPARVARLFDGDVAACLWTDPPYGVEYEGKTARRMTIDNDGPGSSSDVIVGALRLAPLAPSSPFYIAAPAGPRHVAFHEAIATVGWRRRAPP